MTIWGMVMSCDKCKASAEKYRELKEAAAAVIATARPHYNGHRVVDGEAMRWLMEVIDGSKDD